MLRMLGIQISPNVSPAGTTLVQTCGLRIRLASGLGNQRLRHLPVDVMTFLAFFFCRSGGANQSSGLTGGVICNEGLSIHLQRRPLDTAHNPQNLYLRTPAFRCPPILG